jgi:MoaA/NifB/PqqE/SkfB family radical SAM enzyme
LVCGTKIQHAIYARAVEKIVGGRVTRSGYVFPTSRGGGARLERKCTDQELSAALNALFDVVSRGFFPHGTPDNCKFCEYSVLCGGADVAAERTERKFANNEAWQKLQRIK